MICYCTISCGSFGMLSSAHYFFTVANIAAGRCNESIPLAGTLWSENRDSHFELGRLWVLTYQPCRET